MENLEKLLGTLQERNFIFNYGDREVRIDLDTLLSDYDNGTSFIDYISDFYYVQSVYQKLKKSLFGKLYFLCVFLFILHINLLYLL